MSETAKSARAAMKAKAQRLGGKDRPLEKVDSSSWTPPEMLNADVKTGLRPLSRRAYKSGGKVKGDAAKARADRPKRKNGGSALTADSLINRNVKSANAEREGAGKHVGGFKSGGASKRAKFDEMLGASQKKVRDFSGSNISDKTLGRGLLKNAPSSYIRNLAASKGEKDPLDGMKKGGRAEKCGGGEMKRTKHATRGSVPETSPNHPMNKDYSTRSVTDDKGRQVTSDELINNTPPTPPSRPVPTPPERPSNLKKGGRAGKFMGGPLMQPGGMLAGAAPAAGPSGMPAGSGMPGTTPAPIDPRLGIVSKNAMNFSGAQGSPYKKGGAVKHPDVAEDKALIKKMVKGTALKRMEGGKVFSGEGYPHKVPGADGGRTAKAGGGMLDATKRAMMLANDPHVKSSRVTVDQPPPAPQGDKKKHGGRTARASGGRTGKGKTNINIVIAAGKGQQPGMPPAGGLMPPPPPPPAGGGRPVAVPPPPPGGAGAAPMPMPIPMPMPMGGAGAPTGAPPMPRKAGGRITKVAKSYKDMEAGAGSGEGRLQKTDIAKRSMHNKGGKVGHRNYRNYEDMDAGAGGGFGRLEKTEIARKGTGIQKAY